jgi:DNA recombination protein RmuC
MATALLILIALLLLVNIFVSLKAAKNESQEKSNELLAAFARDMREELQRAREEAARSAREGREETGNSFRGLNDSIIRQMAEIAQLEKNQLETFSGQLVNLTRVTSEQLDKITAKQAELTQATEQKLEKVRESVEAKLKSIQDDTSLKLEKMRETVDEKLHRTLEQRLGESFKLVSERLEQVHKGLGEMQSLASGVGDLKKVLMNVKTRGIHGEVLLGNILEQILGPEQYERNVSTKKNSRENVEFAVKLPGADEGGCVYLPLDSKFPLENYSALVDAYEHAEPAKIDEAAKALEAAIKKCAKDIRDKYIDPPNTTDFGIMFLPIEGLYAEALRRTGLFESLQRDFKVNITGPTTLAAFLNSLQMGFKTLAIEKRSSEVWNILGEVKTEFDKFGDILKNAQSRLTLVNKDLESLIGTRTRQIQAKLRKVQKLPAPEPDPFLLEDENR